MPENKTNIYCYANMVLLSLIISVKFEIFKMQK